MTGRTPSLNPLYRPSLGKPFMNTAQEASRVSICFVHMRPTYQHAAYQGRDIFRALTNCEVAMGGSFKQWPHTPLTCCLSIEVGAMYPSLEPGVPWLAGSLNGRSRTLSHFLSPGLKNLSPSAFGTLTLEFSRHAMRMPCLFGVPMEWGFLAKSQHSAARCVSNAAHLQIIIQTIRFSTQGRRHSRAEINHSHSVLLEFQTQSPEHNKIVI